MKIVITHNGKQAVREVSDEQLEKMRVGRFFNVQLVMDDTGIAINVINPEPEAPYNPNAVPAEPPSTTHHRKRGKHE